MSGTSASVQERLRQIPSVENLLQSDAIQKALSLHPRRLMLASVRYILEQQRKLIFDGPESAHAVNLDPSNLVRLILEHLDKISAYTLKNLINATGIIVHTNLGRSIIAEEAVERLLMICRNYSNLEYDLELGQRGSRYIHAESILCELTGAEAALVVNNNAAAVLLTLNTLARTREVIVSRGQLVEIGGSFRIPDVMRSSGAILREVGCTNRTHLKDYDAVINDQTALLLKVHTSNYRIVGFTVEVSLEELVRLGHKHGIPVMEDLGSGSFLDMARFGLLGEPTVPDVMRTGVDVVTFSGDKLLGGPQAGVILGRKEVVAECRKNPLTRALRVDKMTLAVLEATLRFYRDERQALERVPTLRMIAMPLASLEQRAQHLASLIREVDQENRLHVQVQQNSSQVGGGALPNQDLPTYVVVVASPDMSTQSIEAGLRNNTPPIIGRIESDHYLMDVRTLEPEAFLIIQQAFQRILGGFGADEG
jgi:L-seryl-tRNA(Ser) seleniumtransferase